MYIGYCIVRFRPDIYYLCSADIENIATQADHNYLSLTFFAFTIILLGEERYLLLFSL